MWDTSGLKGATESVVFHLSIMTMKLSKGPKNMFNIHVALSEWRWITRHCLWLSGPHINSLGMLCMHNHHMALLGFDQDGLELVQEDNCSALIHTCDNGTSHIQHTQYVVFKLSMLTLITLTHTYNAVCHCKCLTISAALREQQQSLSTYGAYTWWRFHISCSFSELWCLLKCSFTVGAIY